HPDQQPVAHPHHVEGKTRGRAGGIEGVPQDRTLHRRRWRRRERTHRWLARGYFGSAEDADRRRVHRHRHALFVGHHRPAQGHFAAAAGRAGLASIAAVRFHRKALAVPRGHDLSVAGAALPRRAAGRRQPHDQDRRHRHHHGTVRSRSVPRTDSEMGITHTQLVPTMFSRMLKLPEAVRRRYDLSSLKIAVHAAAPCPVPVKEQMIEWWGPIIHEYYGATEGLGFTACNTAEWL